MLTRTVFTGVVLQNITRTQDSSDSRMESAMENSSSRAEERTGLIPLTPSITGNYIQEVYDFLTRPATVSEDEPISKRASLATG